MVVTVGRVTLANPVLVASGTFGFGREFAESCSVDHLGGIVTKTITLAARTGNPPPRLVETPAGLVNSIGLANPGLESFCRDELPWLASLDTRVVVSIGGERPSDYGTIAARLDGREGVSALELNVSCPNVDRGGLAIGCDERAVAETVKVVRSATDLPVWVKLTPNVTDPSRLAGVAVSEGADAVCLINTVRALVIDVNTARPVPAAGGGLSGPAIRPIAVRTVWDTYAAHACDIIGCGGVCTVDDAVQFLLAGARAVSVGSGLFADPYAPWRIIDRLPGRLRELGYGRIEDAVGRAHQGEGTR